MQPQEKPIPLPTKIKILGKTAYFEEGIGHIIEGRYTVDIGLLTVQIDISSVSVAIATGKAINWSIIILRGGVIEADYIEYKPGKPDWNPVGEACAAATKIVRDIYKEIKTVNNNPNLGWATFYEKNKTKLFGKTKEKTTNA